MISSIVHPCEWECHVIYVVIIKIMIMMMMIMMMMIAIIMIIMIYHDTFYTEKTESVLRVETDENAPARSLDALSSRSF